MHKLYLISAAPLQLTSIITESGVEEGHSFVVLESCPFHPRGGGQREDRGWLDQAAVVDVTHQLDGRVRVYHDGAADFTAGQKVDAVVDENWRRLQSRLHTAGHAVAAVAESMIPGAKAFKAHHWNSESYVMFRCTLAEGTSAIAERLEVQLTRDIGAQLAVEVVGDPLAERRIAIGPYPAVSCGGTHVSNLAELLSVSIRNVRAKRGEMKIGYDVETGVR